jgi:hypothetical protein
VSTDGARIQERRFDRDVRLNSCSYLAFRSLIAVVVSRYPRKPKSVSYEDGSAFSRTTFTESCSAAKPRVALFQRVDTQHSKAEYRRVSVA